MNNIGQRVKKLRTENGILLEELCKMTGLCKSTISKIENGKQKVKIEEIELFARVFDVSPAYIAGWEKAPAGDKNHRQPEYTGYLKRLQEALEKEKERTGSRLDTELFIDIFFVYTERSIGSMEEDDELLEKLLTGDDDEFIEGLERALELKINESKETFKAYPQKVRETMLMETSSKITEVLTNLIDDDRLDPDKLSQYGPHERLALICDLTRNFEDVYQNTKALRDGYDELVRHYAERKLMKIFG